MMVKALSNSDADFLQKCEKNWATVFERVWPLNSFGFRNQILWYKNTIFVISGYQKLILSNLVIFRSIINW